MKNTITILGRDFELFWSTQATSEIAEKCGGLNKLDAWIKGNDDDYAGMLSRLTETFEILVNAAIKRDNFAIKHGFMQGEEKPVFELGELKQIIGLNEIATMRGSIYAAMNNDMSYEVPDGVKVESKEIDETLEEIKENRRKKEESGE